MPTRRVYIDSRYRMPGGTDSDFRYALRTPIEVPPGTLGFIDGVVLSQSFGCAIAGYNDAVFVREVYQAGTTDRVLTLGAGDYNGYTLAAELAAKLNAGTTLPNVYAVTFANGCLTVANADVPASIINWGGSESTSIEEWCSYLGELTGLETRFRPSEETLRSVRLDPSRMHERVGRTKVDWEDGIRRMLEARDPELLKSV